MEYAENGSLRRNLQDIVKKKWIVKLNKLQEIINGLEIIHQQNLIHCDFHHGNILNQKHSLSISDLGLCKPVEYFESRKEANKTKSTSILTIDSTTNKTSKNSSSTLQILKRWIAKEPRSEQQLMSQDQSPTDIYGVLPFVAPEILRSKSYTTASDIYSFSMIIWEFTSGIPPFDDIEHGFQLSLSICKGERPEIIENTPQCYIDLMKKCWDKDPVKRPKASEIKKIIDTWISIIIDKDVSGMLNNIAIEFYKADKVLESKQTNISNTSDIINNKSHPQAYHTSRLLDFTQKLNETLNQEDMKIYGYENSENNKSYETEISQTIGNYYNIY